MVGQKKNREFVNKASRAEEKSKKLKAGVKRVKGQQELEAVKLVSA